MTFYLLMLILSILLLIMLAKIVPAPYRTKKMIYWILAFPILTLGVYVTIGTPNMPDFPFNGQEQTKIREEKQEVDRLLGELRGKIKQKDSAEARHFLAVLTLKAGHFKQALADMKKAYTLSKGKNPTIAIDYVELLATDNDHNISPEIFEILTPFTTDLNLKIQDKRFSFYYGLYLFQNNKQPEGQKIWQDLLHVITVPDEKKYFQSQMQALARKFNFAFDTKE